MWRISKMPRPKLGHNINEGGVNKMERRNLTDEELKEKDIRIPDEETDGSFFSWIENMIQEEFKDVPEK